jgi:hypothetical protein
MSGSREEVTCIVSCGPDLVGEAKEANDGRSCGVVVGEKVKGGGVELAVPGERNMNAEGEGVGLPEEGGGVAAGEVEGEETKRGEVGVGKVNGEGEEGEVGSEEAAEDAEGERGCGRSLEARSGVKTNVRVFAVDLALSDARSFVGVLTRLRSSLGCGEGSSGEVFIFVASD